MVDSKDESKRETALPLCVAEADEAATALYRFVSGHDFPQLDEAVSSVEQAAGLIREVIRWALEIDQVHEQVVGLFPPRESGVSVKVPPPQMTRMMMMRTEDGVVPAHEYADQGPAQGNVTYRPFRIDIASDVLEPIPERYRVSMASAVPFAPVEWPRLPSTDEFAAYVQDQGELGEFWRVAVEVLTEAMFVVRSKSLGLVGWIRERVDEMRRATWPEITWVSVRSNGGQTVRVAMAGASWTVELTGGEHRFLQQLAGATPVNELRVTKGRLLTKIPELKPYMTSLGRGKSDSESMYVLSKAVADRVDVTAGQL